VLLPGLIKISDNYSHNETTKLKVLMISVVAI